MLLGNSKHAPGPHLWNLKDNLQRNKQKKARIVKVALKDRF